MGRGYLWGSFLIAAAALKTPTRNGYNAQGVNLIFLFRFLGGAAHHSGYADEGGAVAAWGAGQRAKQHKDGNM